MLSLSIINFDLLLLILKFCFLCFLNFDERIGGALSLSLWSKSIDFFSTSFIKADIYSKFWTFALLKSRSKTDKHLIYRISFLYCHQKSARPIHYCPNYLFAYKFDFVVRIFRVENENFPFSSHSFWCTSIHPQYLS